jgi:ATP-binding cassette subfamily B protein
MSGAEDKKKKSLSVSKALLRTAPMILKAFPFAYLTYALMGIIHGAFWGITAPVNQRMYDALTDTVMGNGAVRLIYISAVWVVLVMLGQQIMNGVHNFFFNYIYNKARGHMSFIMQEKLGKLPAQLFEDKDELDNNEKANNGNDAAIGLLGTLSDGLFFYGAYYAVMATYLWRMKPTLVIAFVFIFAPVAFSQIIRAKMFAKLEEESAPIRRQFAHYEDCLIGKTKLKETRLFGAYHFFKKLYMDTLALLAKKDWNVEKKLALINLGLNGVKAAGWLGVIMILFDALMKGDISVGAFAAVFSSIGMLFILLEEIFNRIQWSVTDNLGKIHNFIGLLEHKEHQGENIPVDFSKGIMVNDVHFTYPKADKPAVNGVSFTIRQGETIALVGENGSGKSTLVKLLSGLFTPDQGNIIIGGRDTAQTAYEALYAKTSGVFQNYCWYPFSLRENVLISEYTSEDSTEPSLHQADVDITDSATFPKGLDTVLSREFDGVELSGGQWQRVAMARGLYRKHEYIVLDEPTAAIDPIEETKVYKRFAESSKDKTAVLVTHRLGSARIADRILVMDGGKIVESGTHDELCGAGGKYAEMWAAQAENYKE